MAQGSLDRSPADRTTRCSSGEPRCQPAACDRATIVVGNPAVDGQLLQHVRQEAVLLTYVFDAMGLASETLRQPARDEVRERLGRVHYLGHGFARDMGEWLPLASGEELIPFDLEPDEAGSLPFMFLCACEAGRMRAGTGGYTTGLATRLFERGAPGVIAFTMPVAEERAYMAARLFYAEARQHPFGAAVAHCCRRLATGQLEPAGHIPSYVWLAMAAFGDPGWRCVETADDPAPLRGAWPDRLRAAAVLRTTAALDRAEAAIAAAPAPLRPLADRLLTLMREESGGPADEVLDELEAAALVTEPPPGPAHLSLRAIYGIERARRHGADRPLDDAPLTLDALERVPRDLIFAARAATTCFDLPLNGLAHLLLGRFLQRTRVVLADWPLGPSASLRIGIDQLAACAPHSGYLMRLRNESLELIGR